MLLDDQAALGNARDVVAIANAVMAAKHNDARRSAVGLITIAQVLVDDDFVGRLVLAELLREAADELLQYCRVLH